MNTVKYVDENLFVVQCANGIGNML